MESKEEKGRKYLVVIDLQCGLCRAECECDLMRASTMEWVNALREFSMADKPFKLVNGTYHHAMQYDAVRWMIDGRRRRVDRD